MRREDKVEDLKVPGDSHAKEETQVYQHLVPPLVGAVTGARARTTNIETVLKLKRIVIAVPCHSFWKGH